jgi:ABC-type phosphate transport system substrate-binding protein
MKQIKKSIFLLSLWFLPALSGQAADNLVFIVNAENPETEINQSTISDFYFKRKRRWEHGEPVRFIDRNADASLRDTFLRTILNKTTSEVELYWIGQKLYSGDSAPLRETSDSATIRFVASFKGALGYISTAGELAEKNVKIIKVAEAKKE